MTRCCAGWRISPMDGNPSWFRQWAALPPCHSPSGLTPRYPPGRAKLSRDAITLAVTMIVVDHLCITGIADTLRVTWNTSEEQPENSAASPVTSPAASSTQAASDP